MRILITRPAEDGAPLAARLSAMGHQAVLTPLLTPRYGLAPLPDLSGVQAILVTSANGVRALVHQLSDDSPFGAQRLEGGDGRSNAKPWPARDSGSHGEQSCEGQRGLGKESASPFGAQRLEGGDGRSNAKPWPARESGSHGEQSCEGQRGSSLLDLPIFAVGPQTAAEARAAGFGDVRDADGDARQLARRAMDWAAPQKGALVHVCGQDAPGTLATLLTAAGFAVRAAPLYCVEAATALPDAAAAALGAGQIDAAMFFSPRSAEVFRDLVARHGGLASQAAALTALCISAKTAAALAPLAFGAVRVAAAPNQDAMLALVE